MGQLVFQATAGGQVALVGPNPTSNFSLNVPATNGNLVTTGDTGTVTNTMLASSAYTAPGTIGSGTPNTGAFTTLSASSTVSGAGFSTYLASPPAIGGTSPSTGKFTTLTSTSNVINGATSGNITIAVPAVAGTNTATLPAATGTVMVSGNMPAFSVYLSGNQTVSANASTKVAFNTKEFDTNSYFDATTNYRFTPLVAGYYQINFMLCFPSGANNCISQLYKNGSLYLTGTRVDSNAAGLNSMVSTVVYFNGSTDYVEGYGYTSGTTFSGGATGAICKFSGAMVRSA